jgi:hypothetical protein
MLNQTQLTDEQQNFLDDASQTVLALASLIAIADSEVGPPFTVSGAHMRLAIHIWETYQAAHQ